MPQLTIPERVERGVQWLDREQPGWRDAINLDTLQIDSFQHCVCAQAFAHQNGFLDVVLWFNSYEIDAQALADHGFSGRLADYPALTAEWKRRIAGERRQERTCQPTA